MSAKSLPSSSSKARRLGCPHCEENLNCVICGQDITTAHFAAVAERDRYRQALEKILHQHLVGIVCVTRSGGP